MSINPPKVCLTIAGLDPSGGAGVVADIRAFSALGCYAAAVITSITFQNTQGVFGSENVRGETVRKQAEPIFSDLDVAAAKTGMLPSDEVIRETADVLRSNFDGPVVVDPVVRSTSGYDLIDDAALDSLIRLMFPLATVVTPNIPEAERIAGIKILTENDIETAGRKIQRLGAANVLIKGGHRPAGTEMALDHLFLAEEHRVLESEWIETTSTHGSGCTLAAAITACLALGMSLENAVERSKVLVTEAIRSATRIGHGHSPVDHLAIGRKTGD